MIKLYFGLPRSGKSTLAARIVYKESKRKKNRYTHIFTNFPCKGAEHIESTDFSSYMPPIGSLVIIDEGGIEFNNRNFKSMKQSTIEFLKLHGHYKVDIIFLSQSWEDVDITIRRLANELIYIRKAGPFTRLRPIRTFIFMDDVNHQIQEGYQFEPLWHMLFILPPFCMKPPVTLFLRCPYYNFFDSYDAPERELVDRGKWHDDFEMPKNVFISMIGRKVNDLKRQINNLRISKEKRN